MTQPSTSNAAYQPRVPVSRGVALIAALLSCVHLLNFLNYTKISAYFDPPLTRSALLVAAALMIFAGHAGNLRLHFRRSWDMYALCALAFMSAIFSSDSTRTLMYAMWLALAVYLGTELSVRIRTPRDVVIALGIVLLPASFLVGAVNLMLGPVVVSTGRHFGALGSAHVDTAYAMNFVCLFLALRAIPAAEARLPSWLRLPMLGLLVWALYQVVLGLTRSVWLAVLLSMTLYLFRARMDIRSLVATLLIALAGTVAIGVMGVDRLLPDAVKGRIEVTEQRYESGLVDPRIEGIQWAFETSIRHPEGLGYATRDSHNSYMNIPLQLGWAGLLLAVIAVGRSALMAWRMGFGWFLFFGVGAAPLLLQAFFETQNTPGQANFIPLLLWYAVSRSVFVVQPGRNRPIRPRFVEA